MSYLKNSLCSPVRKTSVPGESVQLSELKSVQLSPKNVQLSESVQLSQKSVQLSRKMYSSLAKVYSCLESVQLSP